MAAARKARVGDEWQVPERSIVTTPAGTTHTVVGGIFVLQETGTYSNDTGDRVTVEAPQES